MPETVAVVPSKPVWIELSSSDPTASRAFYSRLFGWNVEVSPDPTYGGYALARIGGKDVAGIGPTQSPEAPTAWMIYIGTQDAERLAQQVKAAGGTVVVGPFDVGDQGRMAVFQDPSGAFISTWQPSSMGGFGTSGPNTFGWAELNSRGIEQAIPFYGRVFGWAHATNEMGEGAPPYTEFQLEGESIAGGMEMNPMVPAQVPSYWMVYFAVDDVDGSFQRAIDAGGQEMLGPRDFPGGRLAIVADPQGAAFGLLNMTSR
jgi:predicted enzyme related to lactoylglutathione lyase